ncbi:MAG: hypothetical protein WAO52_03465 [Prolixibacteraceae bacterium]
MKTDKHTLWMIIGCVLPIILIFLAPAFGITSGTSIFIFVAFMFACHLLMPMHGHSGHQHGNTYHHDHSGHNSSKTKNHEQHQH